MDVDNVAHVLSSEVPEVLVVPICHLQRVMVPPPIVLGVDIEAGGIARIPYWRQNGAFSAAVVDIVPVDAVEKGVCLHAGSSSADVAEPAGAVHGTEGSDDVSGVFRELRV